MSTDPFATYADLEAAWRPLSTAERSRADVLLARASRMIRRRWSNVDDRINAGTLTEEDLQDVVLEMVQTAMDVPKPGVEQYAQAAGPFNESYKFSNPNARLYFTAAMLEILDGPPVRAKTAWLA